MQRNHRIGTWSSRPWGEPWTKHPEMASAVRQVTEINLAGNADEVEHKLEERMLGAWQQVVESAAARDLSLRAAATVLAVERVAEAHLLRGLYP